MVADAKKAEAHDDDFKLIYLTLTLILALWNHPRGLGDLVPDPVEGEDVKKLTAGQQVELISKVLAYRRERTARYARLAGKRLAPAYLLALPMSACLPCLHPH